MNFESYRALFRNFFIRPDDAEDVLPLLIKVGEEEREGGRRYTASLYLTAKKLKVDFQSIELVNML